MLSCLRNCQTLFPRSCLILYSCWQCIRIPVSLKAIVYSNKKDQKERIPVFLHPPHYLVLPMLILMNKMWAILISMQWYLTLTGFFEAVLKYIQCLDIFINCPCSSFWFSSYILFLPFVVLIEHFIWFHFASFLSLPSILFQNLF